MSTNKYLKKKKLEREGHYAGEPLAVEQINAQFYD